MALACEDDSFKNQLSSEYQNEKIMKTLTRTYTILGVFLLLFSCDNRSGDYHRIVRFYIEDQLYDAQGQGGHYINRHRGGEHSWEFIATNASTFFKVEASDGDTKGLKESYRHPDVTAELTKYDDSNNSSTSYVSIEGSLNIDGFEKFTREGSFEFVMVSTTGQDTVYITNGSYRLTNTDEPLIRN